MRRAVALLAAVLLLVGAAGCGGDGAEPGAPKGVALVLDFVPGAVHSGLYVGAERGLYRERGIELAIRQPGASTDAPQQLEAGRVDFAVLDIHDLGIARERGLDLVGVVPLVQRPLAALIAHGDGPVRRPRDLEGQRVGVTGLPSDEAVVDSAVAADGGDPAKVERVTIGFNAVASLAAREVAAVTAFWNAEGVALRRRGVPIRSFPVDRYGAPSYPELVLATSRRTLASEPELVAAVVEATSRGYELASERPGAAIETMLAAVPTLERADLAAQMAALGDALHPARFDAATLRAWAAWDRRHGILQEPFDVGAAFDLG